jgi:hypothetical protein
MNVLASQNHTNPTANNFIYFSIHRNYVPCPEPGAVSSYNI